MQTATTHPHLHTAGKVGLALIIANELRGLIVVSLIVKAWVAAGGHF